MFVLPMVTMAESFTVIPDLDVAAVAAFDVTPDGQHVVGTSNGSLWIWSAATGTQLLTSPDWFNTFTAGVCDDASTVVSAAINPGSGLAEPILVDTGTGTITYLGGVAGATGCDTSLATAWDISGDCSKVVGLSWDGCIASGFEWTAGGGVVSLGGPGGGFSSRASAIARDGSAIFGFYEHPINGCRRPVKWQAPNVPELFLGAETCGEATASTTDGSVIVGAAIPPLEFSERAFRYQTTGDMVTYLGTINPWDERSLGNAVSDNGIVVGVSGTFGPFGSLEAFIWTETEGMRSLKQVLLDAGLSGLSGYQLVTALGITPDGQTIVGQGVDPSFNTIAWVVSLHPCGDFDGDSDNDANDETAWHACYSAFNPLTCDRADCDGDGDVDCADWSNFKQVWTGPPTTPAFFPACDADCNNNGIADDFEEPDCNLNNVPDGCDIDAADPDGNGEVSTDCNNNSTPDECEADCNFNNVPDDCDVNPADPDGNGSVSADCNGNGLPDECWPEIDCDFDGVPDDCDLNPTDPDGDGVVATDCNANGTPDHCEFPDCNENDFPDECDLNPGDPDGNGAVSSDCQGNGVPDECEIAGGESNDCQPDTVPDECQLGDIVANVFLDETFDTISSDNFPPAGWEHVTVGSCDFAGWSADIFDGQNAAPSAVHWANFGNCDDYLISPVINTSVASLTLWTDGCSGAFCDAIDVEILLVIGALGGGDDIFVGSLREVWSTAVDPYDWNEGTWDLTPLLSGGSFRVAFRYFGENGDSIAIDDVLVREILGPAPNDCNFNRVPDDCEPNADGDALPDVCDGCPNDPAKLTIGACGCGVADTDNDFDGTPNCNDGCPNDANKIQPGVCGCGVSDVDTDGDTVANCYDVCPGGDDLVDANGNGTPDDCDSAGAIPTISEWGIVILGLLLLTSAKVAFRRAILPAANS